MPTAKQRYPMRALYAHARAVRLTSVPDVSVRSCRAVLIALVGYVDRDSWAGAWPAVSTLAARAEVSVRTARRALRVLEANGVIATTLGGGRRSSTYRIIPPASTSASAPGASPEPDSPPDPDPPPAPEPAPGSDSPSSPPTGQRGRNGRRSPVFIPHLSPFGAARSAARSRSTVERLRELPEDLIPLAQELFSRGLRASFSLTADEVAEVRQALARHGVGPLVRAAYAAHQPLRPARWWSAWIGLWSGLTTRPPARSAARPAAADTPPPRRPDITAAGLAACRAALTARRPHRKPAVSRP